MKKGQEFVIGLVIVLCSALAYSCPLWIVDNVKTRLILNRKLAQRLKVTFEPSLRKSVDVIMWCADGF